MEIFGANWANHWNKIQNNWLKNVSDDDFVLLPGDISWAMKFNDALADLAEVNALPGKKVITRGNHDYWWQTVTKMNKLFNGKITFIQNNFTPAGVYAICGSRGWLCPDDPAFSIEDQKIYSNELNRIKLSLEAAVQAGFCKIILMLHYPPVYFPNKPTEISKLIDLYKVETCIFGHIHGNQAHMTAFKGLINNTSYHLVSCDALDFKLLQIR